MTVRRDEIVARIVTERVRQFNLPGIELDTLNHPNDWVAIIGHYLFGEVERGPDKPTRAAFEDRMIKAAAVFLAALEHADVMERDGRFAENG